MKNTIDTSKRFGFIIVIIIILFAVALIGFTRHNSKRIIRQNQGYLIDSTEQIASDIDHEIIAGYDNIKILSSLVSKSLASSDFDIKDIQELIQNSVFDFMEFADKNGYDHNITGSVSDARDRQYYLDAKAGNTGMEIIYDSRATHETLLMFYSPIYFKEEFVGSLVGVYQASNRITTLLTNTFFGESSLAYLAEENGRVIASCLEDDPQKELYLTDLFEGDSNIDSIIKTSMETGETKTFSMKDNLTGGCITKLPQTGWYVLQIFPPEASQQMISEGNILGYIFGLFLVFLAILLLLHVSFFYKKQQKEVEKALLLAESANRAKTTFLFNMSHDIRTPMNAILGYSDMAEKYKEDPERLMDCIDKIKQSSNLLLSLINSVLEMSRIESGNAELNERPCSIHDSFRNIDTIMIELARAKNIDLSFEFKNIQNDLVCIDYDRMNRVLTNIISNAIKYTENEGSVKVFCEQLGMYDENRGLYQYTFEDNGIGISEDFQEHLFDEFAREYNSTTSGIQGTGLGLNVVKVFLTLMDGTIECNSKKGEGTTFIIKVPFKLQKSDEENLSTDSVLEDQSEDLSNISIAGLKVLLVEDNALNYEIASYILQEEGLIIEGAETGHEAIEKVKERGPDYFDFILMDIQMPIMDGYEATKKIRALYPDSKLPVIALSANAFMEDKLKSIEAGMNDHVSKPIDIAELKCAIIKAIY